MKSKTGRPAFSKKQVDDIFRKLEPYLKAGISLHKACLQAGIPKSTAYDLKRTNKEFSEKIELTQNHQSILVTSIINTELEKIDLIQKSTTKNLNRDQLKFVQWVAVNSRATKEEFDRGVPPEKKKRVEAITDDPRVFNTILGTYRSIMEGIGYKITAPDNTHS